jgi:hypothetical protein
LVGVERAGLVKRKSLDENLLKFLKDASLEDVG